MFRAELFNRQSIMEDSDKQNNNPAPQGSFNPRATQSPWQRSNTADPTKNATQGSQWQRRDTADPIKNATQGSQWQRRNTADPLKAAAPRTSQAPRSTQATLPPMQPQNNGAKGRKLMIWIIVGLLAIIAGLAAWFVIESTNQKKALEEAIALKDQAELDASQRDLQNAYDELNNEFSMFENQRRLVMDDSVKRDLTMKYENARLQIEKLQSELRNQRNLSAAEIQRLKDEITTLRHLLRHYVEEINRLNLENDSLRNENAAIRGRNEQLTSRVEETTRRNKELNERMTLAEKLNVTGLQLVALNKKGKIEKKVEKARQLRVTFTIPQNNSTPVGQKTIYMRITSPSGQVLGGGGTFTFEGSTLECTARTTVEYSGEELAGVTIFWDINTALTAGDYTVELFADNFRLISRSFPLN